MAITVKEATAEGLRIMQRMHLASLRQRGVKYKRLQTLTYIAQFFISYRPNISEDDVLRMWRTSDKSKTYKRWKARQ